MTENGVKSDKCRFCKSSFSNEILKKIEDNRDDVYCENCGDIIKRVQNGNINELNTITKTTPNIPVVANEPSQEVLNNPDALLYPNGRVYYDTDFPQIFKSNFIIVFSRLVYFHALHLEEEDKINMEELEITENIVNEIHRRISPIHEKRIKAEFVRNLHEISKEKFERNLKQLQAKIQSNRKYREDFIVYSRWLIKRVLTIVSEKKEINKCSKFERTIIKDLKRFELIDYYKRNFAENKKLTQLNKPRDLVNHYFKEYGKCCFNRKLTKDRHNFILKNNYTLLCPDCKKVLKNNEFSESVITMRNNDLKKLENSKSFGDITIYRVYFTRTLANGKKEWLTFPGIGYEGQTINTIEERIYNGHIKNAFDVKKKHTYFENTIKRNFIIKDIARRYIRFKILQIIRFQGDINAIHNIANPIMKSEKLEEAINSTQKLADNAEKFWIGYYKTQYKEFGRNIEVGGKENRITLIHPVKLDEEIRNIAHIRRSRGPFEKLRKELNTTRRVLINNLLYYYGKSLKDITHNMLLKDTQELFELGYVVKEIALKLRLEGELENASKTISDWIRNEIYNERFPEKPNYRRIRDKILSEIIEKKVKEGCVTLKLLMQALPGFEVPGETRREKSWELKRFVINNLGGIKKLNKKYSKPKKDYLNDAINIIKDYYKTKKRLSAVKLAFELGFCKDFGYTEKSLRKNAASRYIPMHTGKTMKELIEIALI